MIRRLDHIVIAVRDLTVASRTFTRALGLEVRPGGAHPGAGTHNAIVRFGLDYLELLAVRDPEEATLGRLGADRLLSFLEAREGLVGFALASDDLDADVDRAVRAGLEVAGPFPMQRQRPDGRVLSWRLAYPSGEPWRQPAPFLIQWTQPDAERLAWEPPAAHPLGVKGVVGVAVVVRDIDAAIRQYGSGLGLILVGRDQVPDLGARRATIALADGCVDLLAPSDKEGVVGRSLAEAGEGPFEVRLAVRSLDQARRVLERCGTTFGPVPDRRDGLLVAPDQVHDARIVLVEDRI